ncbi:EboA domain-containing protein [Streptomyces sp. N35]|uniref:EboA domain-containing protein n=1 Tax=Streptomyces sp. N35 TaxID=2795730 RepID=UPI0018F2D62F|nr:EboA domain-containing protein [Streptomyces sp. N35]
MTSTPALGALRARLESALDDDARAWLAQALAAASAQALATAPAQALATAPAQQTPSAAPAPQVTASQAPAPTWELRFAQAGRRCGPEHADDARLLLLHAARADAATLTRLYEQGTAAERRAVLGSLAHLVPGPEALGLTEDALRTNDTSLVAAAVGPYGAEHLDAHAWRHAVLKCLFTGVSVDAVAALADRARGDGELARMLGDYARERTAAGRPVPGDLQRVLALTEAPTEGPTEAPTEGPTGALTEGPTEQPAEAASAASPQES